MGILTTNDRVWVLMILLLPKHSLTNNCFIIILGAFILNPMQQVLHNFLHLPLDPLQGGKQSSYSPQQPFFAQYFLQWSFQSILVIRNGSPSKKSITSDDPFLISKYQYFGEKPSESIAYRSRHCNSVLRWWNQTLVQCKQRWAGGWGWGWSWLLGGWGWLQ